MPRKLAGAAINLSRVIRQKIIILDRVTPTTPS